jgi:hypothetical protein
MVSDQFLPSILACRKCPTGAVDTQVQMAARFFF